MKRISIRSFALWGLIAILLAGMGLFLADYSQNGKNWVLHEGSPHVYEPGATVPVKGYVTDRNGQLLLSYGQGRVYAETGPVRAATMHWLGDRRGNIYAPMISHYTQQMMDYNLIDGIYNYGNQGGKATLTLDASVQQAALEAMGSYRGTVAVYNYKTGQILCAVTTPTFDPDAEPDLSQDPEGKYEGVYLNRFTQSSYIPGSVFKIVTTAAALEAVEDAESFTFTCTGVCYYGADQVTCQIPHGQVDLKDAMRVSCNCYYSQLALKLGAENLQTYANRFGALQSLSFDGITTAQGNMSLENAAAVELAWSAIGQHKDQINPCSFLTFVGAIANGGQGALPYMVESIHAGGRLTYRAQIRYGDQIMSARTAQILKEYMRNNVVNYYGANSFPGLTVCAKSGTGEVGGGKEPNALFTGFVSDSEYPLAFICVVENGGYGQTVCVPVLSKVLAACKASIDNA